MPLFVVNRDFEYLDIDAFALPYCPILKEYYSKNYYKTNKLIDIFDKLCDKNKLVYFNNQSIFLDFFKTKLKEIQDFVKEPIPRVEEELKYLTEQEVIDKEIEDKYKSNKDNNREIIDDFYYCINKRNRAIRIIGEYIYDFPEEKLELTIDEDFGKPIILLNYMIYKNLFINHIYEQIIKFALEKNLYKIAIPIINFDEESSQRCIDNAKSAVRRYLNKIDEDITVYLILIENDNNYYINHKLDDERFLEYEEIKEEEEEEEEEKEKEGKFEERDTGFDNLKNESRIICCEYGPPQKKKKDFDCLLKERLEKRDESFSEMVMRKINEKNIGRVECYKAANVNKNIFSKITKEIHGDEKNDGSRYVYHPDKKIVLAFIIALKLNRSEAEEMMKKAGFAFTSSPQDIIVQLFIDKGIYDIDYVNQYMFRYNQPLLGTTSRDS